MNLYRIDGETLRLDFHQGQTRAWDSMRRFVFVIAGTQSGKTSWGPWWLDREIKRCGPGFYLAVSANYDLFKLKMLPELTSVFRLVRPDLQYSKSERVFSSPDGKTLVILRSADSEGGLESATANAAWLDECGQPNFGLSAWEAVQRRVALKGGRVLGTTTPYNMGWLKTQVYDKWAKGNPDFDVVQFKSIDNPAFPRDEYERARRDLPSWKFRMFYMAEFARPAGMIYDCWEPERYKMPSFTKPADWQSAGGLDFGGNNTAAVRVCFPPDRSIFYVTDEYLNGNRTSAEHNLALTNWGCGMFVGGSWSEGQWRLEFQSAGMPIKQPPVSDVETGIQRVYSAIKEGRLFICESCPGLLDEIERYSRETDSDGQPTAAIKDKRTYHHLDALRYIMAELNSGDNWIMS